MIINVHGFDEKNLTVIKNGDKLETMMLSIIKVVMAMAQKERSRKKEEQHFVVYAHWANVEHSVTMSICSALA